MEIKSKQFNVEFNNLLILYRHYKDYLLPVGVILASIAVLFFIVIPQFQQYLTSLNLLKAETQKLQILKNNYNFLSSLDDSKSTDELKTLSLVLPSDKDFAGIVNAISNASAKTGVAIGDFEFSVGNLSGASEGAVSASPSIKIDINLSGSTQAIVQYINELYKTAPVSEVSDIKASSGAGDITVFFYYKPYVLQNTDNSVPIAALSGSNLSLIQTVSSWSNSRSQTEVPLTSTIFSSTPASSGGASLRSGSFPF
jgi:hypothetical protein